MDKTKVEIVSPVNPEGSKILWQPSVVMVPVLDKPDRPALNYPGMKVTTIRIFSALCIVLGIASIGVQIAALVIYATSLFNCVVSQMDVAGHGIWAGALYLIAGSLAIAATHKRTQSLMLGTVVLALLSICASLVASTLSGIAAAHGIYKSCYYHSSSLSSLCDSWMYLEWTLLSISILAFFSTLTLIFLMTLALFNKRKGSTNEDANVVRPGNGANQTIYLKAQSINQLPLSQQHYRPDVIASNLQVVYVGRENNQQLESVQLVPIFVPAQPHQHQQQQQPAPINETVNFQLQRNHKPASSGDPKKTIKITSSTAQQAASK